MIIVDVDETECNHTIHEIVREPLRFRVKRKCVKVRGWDIIVRDENGSLNN